MITDEMIKAQKDTYNKALKKMFGNKIKQNFLIEIKDRVQKQLGMEMFQYFNISFDINNLVSGINDIFFDFEICRMIVSCHRANTVFLEDSERALMQQSEEYKKKLVSQVIEEVRLRRYSGIFFRKVQLVPGDEFLFFPVLYKLFAISVNATSLINLKSPRREFYVNIFNKALATMTMMENNFMDSAYPSLRGVIELYVKSIFSAEEAVLNEINDFMKWDLLKTASSEYPEDFLLRYENRKDKSQRSIVDYLHYGWVDCLEGYHKIVQTKPYSIYGLFEYLQRTSNEDSSFDFELLQSIYTRCHAFAHGNIGNTGYPLLHYFELTIGLYLTVVSTYEMLCEEVGKDTMIEGIDITNSTHDDFKTLLDQYNKKSTENFEKYYKK
jgi:hypothetical protein